MAKTETPSDVLPGTIFTARQVKILTVAVIVMGILLVGGFAFLMTAIVYQASHLNESATPPATTTGNTTKAGLTVPDGMVISHMALDGNRLAVHLSGPSGTEIQIIDLVSGKVITRLPVKSE